MKPHLTVKDELRYAIDGWSETGGNKAWQAIEDAMDMIAAEARDKEALRLARKLDKASRNGNPNDAAGLLLRAWVNDFRAEVRERKRRGEGKP